MREHGLASECTIGQTIELLCSNDAAAWNALGVFAARAAMSSGQPRDDFDDIASETLMRCLRNNCQILRIAPQHVRLKEWIAGVARNVGRRQHTDAVVRSAQEHDCACQSISITGDADPALCWERADSQQELASRIHEAICTLRPPLQQIAKMRLHGARMIEVASFLAAWRGVGADEARRLWRMTTDALRIALGGATLPEKMHMDGNPTRNPWAMCAPPPPTTPTRA